jgi:hypothetical protein
MSVMHGTVLIRECQAFCVEVRAVVRRHQTDAIIEHHNSAAKKSDVAVSLIEMYNTQTRSKVGAQQFVWPIVNLEVCLSVLHTSRVDFG